MGHIHLLFNGRGIKYLHSVAVLISNALDVITSMFIITIPFALAGVISTLGVYMTYLILIETSSVRVFNGYQLKTLLIMLCTH